MCIVQNSYGCLYYCRFRSGRYQKVRRKPKVLYCQGDKGIYLCITEQHRPEDVYFLERIYSRYDEHKVMFSSFTQQRILSERLDDHDYMYEIQCSLTESDEYRLLNDNPLHMGFFWIESQVISFLEILLHGTFYVQSLCPIKGENTRISFVEDLNTTTGDIIYKKPNEGLYVCIFK